MLNFEFSKWFHVENNKIKLSYLIKYLKWFSDEDLGAFP
jgi:hypothetical protein